jgi:hypothetical protein
MRGYKPRVPASSEKIIILQKKKHNTHEKKLLQAGIAAFSATRAGIFCYLEFERGSSEKSIEELR